MDLRLAAAELRLVAVVLLLDVAEAAAAVAAAAVVVAVVEVAVAGLSPGSGGSTVRVRRGTRTVGFFELLFSKFTPGRCVVSRR